MNATINNSGNQSGQPRPAGQGLSKSARQRRNRRLRNANISAPLLNSSLLNSTVSLGDLSRTLSLISNSGPGSQRGGNRQPRRRGGQKNNGSGVRSGVVARKGQAEDTAKYLAAVFDPSKAAEGVKVVHGVVSSYPTAAVKHTFTGVVKGNADGKLQLVAAGGEANNLAKVAVFNHQDITENWTSVTGAVGLAGTRGTDKVASDMMSKKRQVAMSLKLAYIGPKDMASGTAFSTFMPYTLANLNQAFTPSQLAEQHYTTVAPLAAGTTLEVIWLPREDKDLDFTAPNESNGNGSCVITVDGGMPLGLYRWTLTSHEEYIPSLTNNIATIGVARQDDRAGAIIHNTAQSVKDYVTSNDSSMDLSRVIFDKISGFALDAGSSLLETGLESVLSSFMSLV